MALKSGGGAPPPAGPFLGGYWLLGNDIVLLVNSLGVGRGVVCKRFSGGERATGIMPAWRGVVL
jgi:hypothetical protein